MRRRPETKYSLWCHPHQAMHPKTFFSKSKHTASGFRFACKEIISQKNRGFHEKNKERHRLRHKALRQLRMASPERLTWVLKSMLDHARTHAVQSKGRIEFSLTLSDLDLPTHCPVFGWELVYQASGRRQPNSASLDRIDSRLGYVPGNVWVISWRANQIKMDSIVEELRAVANAMEKYHGTQKCAA
jgi:hypothetical protein